MTKKKKARWEKIPYEGGGYFLTAELGPDIYLDIHPFDKTWAVTYSISGQATIESLYLFDSIKEAKVHALELGRDQLLDMMERLTDLGQRPIKRSRKTPIQSGKK